MKEIQLTHGQVALVDDVDFEWLNQRKWWALWSRQTKSYYAVRCVYHPSTQKTETVRMHRQILGLVKGDKMYGDHINRDTLDNQRSNLRVATRSENQRNRGLQSNNTSGYRGVWYFAKCRRWQSYIKVHGKRRHLGLFLTAEEAALAYNRAAVELHGEFAVLNVLPEPYVTEENHGSCIIPDDLLVSAMLGNTFMENNYVGQ